MDLHVAQPVSQHLVVDNESHILGTVVDRVFNLGKRLLHEGLCAPTSEDVLEAQHGGLAHL